MERPETTRGWMQKRGPSASKASWNKRWVVLSDNKLAYYKDDKDPQPIGVLDLARATLINQLPESYPKNSREGAFSIDIREGKEIRTYYMAAKSLAAKEVWLSSIVKWSKWAAAQKKAQSPRTNPTAAASAGGEAAVLRKQLAEANATIAALKAQLEKVKAQLEVKEEPAPVAADSGADGDLRAQVEVLQETVAAEQSKNRRLEEELEEERFMSSDLKRQFLEQKKQLQSLLDD